MQLCNIFILTDKGIRQAPVAPSLETAISETIKIRRENGRAGDYIKGLEWYLRKFAAGREKHPISLVDTETIEAWFRDRKEKPVTKASNVGRLSSMFDIAWRRGWIDENPCRRIIRQKIEFHVPKVLSVDECVRACDWVCRHAPTYSAWFALSLFCGLRPDEAKKITWESIYFIQGRVVIDAHVTKVRCRRIVELSEAALAWLQWSKDNGGKLPLSKTGKCRFQHRLRRVLGFATWPQDCIRHTAASMLLATLKDVGKVATQLGNSPSVLMRHYCELVTKEDAEKFWSIRPLAI